LEGKKRQVRITKLYGMRGWVRKRWTKKRETEMTSSKRNYGKLNRAETQEGRRSVRTKAHSEIPVTSVPYERKRGPRSRGVSQKTSGGDKQKPTPSHLPANCWGSPGE